MSESTTSILPVKSSSDIPALSHLLYEAKIALPINRLLWKYWPNTAVQLSHYVIALESSLKSDSVDIYKVVNENNTTEPMIGYIVVSHKQAVLPEGQEGAAEQEAPVDFVPEVFKEVMVFARECDALREVEHIEITHVFVKPQYRRRGIGKQLLKLAIDKARETGLPLYVGSEPIAHDFFESQGFVHKKFVDVELAKWAPKRCGFGTFRFSGMVHEPK